MISFFEFDLILFLKLVMSSLTSGEESSSLWFTSSIEHQETIKDEFGRINRVNSGPIFTQNSSNELFGDLSTFSNA